MLLTTWQKKVHCAYIQYYALYNHTGVPGGYNASVNSLMSVADCIWILDKKYCSSGYVVHGICIMTSADLFRVSSKVNIDNLEGPMFHNKYFMERDHTVMDCMEEQLVIRNRLEFKRDCLA